MMTEEQLIEKIALAMHAVDCGCVVSGNLDDPQYTEMAKAAYEVFRTDGA